MTTEIGQGVWSEDILDQAPIAALYYPIRARQRDPLHSHGYHQIAYCEDADATLVLVDRVIRMGEHTALFVPGGTMHALTSRTRCMIRCIYFNAALPTAWVEPVSLNRLTKELISKISDPYTSESSRTLMMSCLYDQIGELFWVQLRGDTSLSRALRAVCDRILEDPASDASVAALANRVCVSERTLRRLAQNQLGCSIAQFRIKCRVFEAARQLQAGVPIKHVSTNVGFLSDSAFFAAFKSVIGMTPAQFRRSVRASR